MAAFNKFNIITEDVAENVHNFDADTLKILLTDTAPVATNSVKADLTEISAGFGYTAGGFDVQNATSRVSGVTSVTGVDVTMTASGGSIGPYRYVVLYNDTPTSPADPLIGWWDKGASVTLLDTQSDLFDFGSSLFTIT
jgi:hypothetical protein